MESQGQLSGVSCIRRKEEERTFGVGKGIETISTVV
jgi:hypothetical protein